MMTFSNVNNVSKTGHFNKIRNIGCHFDDFLFLNMDS